jgi:hypothetical protein
MKHKAAKQSAVQFILKMDIETVIQDDEYQSNQSMAILLLPS